MSDATVLEAFRDILEGISQPEEPDGLLIIKIAPDDEPINIESFPTIIISHDFWEDDIYQRYTQVDYRRSWVAKVDVLLGEKDLPEGEIDRLARPWHKAMVDVLMVNPTLNGTVEFFGNALENSGEAWRGRTQFIHWYDQKTEEPKAYWGVEFRINVTQVEEFAETS